MKHVISTSIGGIKELQAKNIFMQYDACAAESSRRVAVALVGRGRLK